MWKIEKWAIDEKAKKREIIGNEIGIIEYRMHDER
jgi:hypothetical protein